MDDIDRVLTIARRYGVQVFLMEGFPHRDDAADPRGLHVVPLTTTATNGPLAHYCDPAARTVWFDHLEVAEVETHLHEVCHVIMQPPGCGIDGVTEDVLLMPFERTLARQCLHWKGYKRVVSWQLNTQVDWWFGEVNYTALDELPGHANTAYWRESFAALRRMGAIKNGRVTWNWPNWARCPKALLERDL